MQCLFQSSIHQTTLAVVLCFNSSFCIAEVNSKQTLNYSSIHSISHSEMSWLGDKIYQNECASKPENLTFWGEGEDFPSMGIGHFIWFTGEGGEPFYETFPAMFEYVAQFKSPPSWMVELSPFVSPWKSKRAFDNSLHSARLIELKQWLLSTRGHQAQFIVNQFSVRFENALLSLDKQRGKQYQKIINRMLAFKLGRFALIDYVNFKGLGNINEQYQGEQWGLISVLDSMLARDIEIDKITDTQLLKALIDSAKLRLKLRVKLAPKERMENRWLKGWYKRLDGYVVE
jgi:hypothetical protein